MRYVFAFVGVALAAFVGVGHGLAAGPDDGPVVGRLGRIHDADTFWIGTTKIRLNGLDAPESDQVCLDAARQQRPCGADTRAKLIEHIGGRALECRFKDWDGRYKRAIMQCSVDGEDVNAWLVAQGLARVDPRFDQTYVPLEDAARREKRGWWAGAFIAPWDWRHSATQAGPDGALAVSSAERETLWTPVSAVAAPSPACIIKGNVNGRRQRYYFMPRAPAYDKVKMDPSKGKRWFCSEPEARAAGWRAAQ